MTSQRFYSHGKLLLTGEYVILDGALGLAFPTRQGQALTVSPSEGKAALHWKSLDKSSQSWFEASFELPSLEILRYTEKKTATILKKILQATQRFRENFLQNPIEISVETRLEFPGNWGLGSSSTLINNIAQWAKIDPYALLWNCFSGSGYDIACAMNHRPLLYRMTERKPQVTFTNFDPPFKGVLYFLYLNKKQDSNQAIHAYRTKIVSDQSIELISSLTQDTASCTAQDDFEKLLSEHERSLSKLLNMPTLKERCFPDYPGMIKSLGAWGGDFALVSLRKGMKNYFSRKGLQTMIPFEEMILSH
ncbi:MAG: GYDIA family GHMP kinase [Flavobacteriales bacterium Tduv]